MNRLTTSKKLVTFDGNPLEWRSFNQTYETSSVSGGYSNEENVTRLFEALKGETRSAVENILATGTKNPDIIMKTLELRFGNENLILSEIVLKLKKLLSICSGEIDIVNFSSKLNNAVSALDEMNNIGYLFNKDLLKELLYKLPQSMVTQFVNQTATTNASPRNLVALSDFMIKQAQKYADLGIVDLSGFDCVANCKSSTKEKSTKSVSSKSCAVLDSEPVQSSDLSILLTTKNDLCLRCESTGHLLPECKIFARETTERRWLLARKYRVCFVCLKLGHRRDNCKARWCKFCRGKHHEMLHDAVPSSISKPDTKGNDNLKTNLNTNQDSIVNLSNSDTMESPIL